MTDKERRQYDMLVRVREFGKDNAANFPAASIGGKAFAAITTAIDALDEHGARQSSSANAGSQSSMRKVAAREDLRDKMREIAETARAIALDNIGIGEKFRRPRNNSDQNLLNAARAFAADAVAFKTTFVEYGLPADFIEELNDDIKNFETIVNEKVSAITAQVTATAAIDEAIENAMTATRRLRPVVRNVFRNAPAKLAAWESASHTERPDKPKTPPTAKP